MPQNCTPMNHSSNSGSTGSQHNAMAAIHSNRPNG